MDNDVNGWDHRSFEQYAGEYFSRLFDTTLETRPVQLPGGVIKKFDLVSADQSVVGDVKFYKELKVPAAKWSTIAEYVWLLQKCGANRTFLVFGNDASVAERWLARFRPIAFPVEFYFLNVAGHRLL